MAEKYKKVRYSGCRSPLVVGILLILCVIIFVVVLLLRTDYSTDPEFAEFVGLLNQEYDSVAVEGDAITNSSYSSLYSKINNSMSNSQNLLFDNQGNLRVDVLGADSTYVNQELTLNGQDIACLINLMLGQYQDDGADLSTILQARSCVLNTNANITDIRLVFRVDLSGFISVFTLLNITNIMGNLQNLPEYFYLTMNAELDNSRANNYILSSSIRINQLSADDNQIAMQYIYDNLSIEGQEGISNITNFTVDVLIGTLRDSLKNWGASATFVNNSVVVD